MGDGPEFARRPADCAWRICTRTSALNEKLALASYTGFFKSVREVLWKQEKKRDALNARFTPF